MLFSHIIQQIYNIDALTTVLVAVFTLFCLILSNLWRAHRPTLIMRSTTIWKCVVYITLYQNYIIFILLLLHYNKHLCVLYFGGGLPHWTKRAVWLLRLLLLNDSKAKQLCIVVASERVGTIYNQLQNLYNIKPYTLYCTYVYIIVRITAHCWRRFSPFIFFQSHLTHTVEMRYIQFVFYIKVSRKICLCDI